MQDGVGLDDSGVCLTLCLNIQQQRTDLRRCDLWQFLLSEIEVQGTRTFSYPGEGTQYEYYKTAANREKNRAWYLRSPRINNTSCFCRTGWSGEAHSSVASEVDGIAAAWCF